ncbi:MAG TPA: lytic transglycosylase domain-containing protein [bacterium]|nr:lytic transglycosylase domain-containing protein [bacterium]HPN45788.1 lytic transglycosylase domain-containing protein [bacterium]
MEKQIKRFNYILNLSLKALLVIMLIVICTVGLKITLDRKNEKKILEMQSIINELRTALNIDSVRQYNIKKVISIIDQYNIKMPRYQKYEIAEEIFNMANTYSNLNVDLICATITWETGGTWNAETVSPSGALGLMQIMPVTGMFVAGYEDINWSSAKEVLFNPIYNIRIGCRYLSALIELYDVDGGLAAFIDGQRRAALWVGKGRSYGVLSDEAREIVPAIQQLYEEYQQKVQ